LTSNAEYVGLRIPLKSDLYSSFIQMGRGGLVIRSRLQGRTAPDSKPNSTKDPRRMQDWCTPNLTSCLTRPPVDVMWKCGEESVS
ncbi:hypothetical protein AVEN_60389-1, partial [Araneus ventricosus]